MMPPIDPADLKAARLVLVSVMTHGLLSGGHYTAATEAQRVETVTNAEKLAALILERNPIV